MSAFGTYKKVVGMSWSAVKQYGFKIPKKKMKDYAKKNPGYYEPIMFAREVLGTTELFINFTVKLITLKDELFESFVVCMLQIPRLGMSFIMIYTKNLNLYHEQTVRASKRLDDFYDGIKDAYDKGY